MLQLPGNAYGVYIAVVVRNTEVQNERRESVRILTIRERNWYFVRARYVASSRTYMVLVWFVRRGAGW